MSEQPMGPDWWMASDHKWYPPELHPSRSSDAAPASGGDGTTATAPADGTVVAEAGEDGWRVGPANEPDRYGLHERHSRGNEGDLWRASLTLDDVEIPIALKVTHPEDVSDLDEAKQRWQRQADLLGSLDHPGLVKVRELFFGAAPHRPGGADDSTTVLCLAMNWAEGERLDEWVKARPDRSLSEVITVLGKVADALEYLHRGVGGRAVLHRNLKPGNILVDGDDVRLVGFGTARLMKLDAQMTIVGTPAWMPPEVLNGEAYDEAADLWSLGAIAFYLVCGSPPPLLSVDKARAQLADTSLLGDRPQLVDDIVALLDPTPSQRPPSPKEWVQGFLVHSSMAAAAEPAATPEPEPEPAATPEPAPVEAAPEPEAAPALDLSKPAADEPVAVADAPIADAPIAEAPIAEAPAASDAAAPVAEVAAAPGEPVWDEATQTWRDPASGAVWDPATSTWSTPAEAVPDATATYEQPAPEQPSYEQPSYEQPSYEQQVPAPPADAGYAAAPPPPDPGYAAAPPPPDAPQPPVDPSYDPSAAPAEGQWAVPPGDPAAYPAPPPAAAAKSSRTGLIIGVVLALVVVVAIIVALLVL